MMNKIFLLLIATVLVVACKNDSSMQQEESTTKIVYNVLVDEDQGDYEVFTMNLDGSDKQNLSQSPTVDWAYYAYNDQVYFISDRDTCGSCFYLYRIHSNGTGLKKITDFRVSDSWLSSCKNGKEIIVKPHASVDSCFYIISEEGKLISKLNPGLAYVSDPLFIDNGQKVVFRGSQTSNKQMPGYLDELYMVNRDGKALKQLTYYPQSDTTAMWYNYHAGPPQWMDNWGVISYISFQKGSYSIFTVDTLGGNLSQLSKDGYNQGWHAWSSDGMLVFDGSDTSPNANYDIYLLMPDSTQTMRLTTDSLYEQAPFFVEYFPNKK